MSSVVLRLYVGLRVYMPGLCRCETHIFDAAKPVRLKLDDRSLHFCMLARNCRYGVHE